MLVEEDCREDGDDSGGHEDEDVKERQRNVAQSDYDADVVGEVETGAGQLPLRMRWPERRDLASREGVGSEERGDDEAQESDDFVSGKVGPAYKLDDAIRKDPAGEAGDGENDRAQVRMAWRPFALQEVGLGIGGQDDGTAVGLEIRVAAGWWLAGFCDMGQMDSDAAAIDGQLLLTTVGCSICLGTHTVSEAIILPDATNGVNSLIVR